MIHRLSSKNLIGLATYYGTDKWGGHRYAQHYAHHFHAMRNQPVVLLEIGVGGHTDPASGGASLRMWKHYFRKGKIYGIDLHDKSPHEEHRIKIFQGDQSDRQFLLNVIQEIGTPDIIIDDGSHVVDHVRVAFDTLFPLLATNGIYVVEDLQTSYWPEFGGSPCLSNDWTTLGWLKKRVDGLNYEEYLSDLGDAESLDRSVTGLHFYHNLAFVQKGENAEGSNQSLVRGPNATRS
jgi:hypothetical protein